MFADPTSLSDLYLRWLEWSTDNGLVGGSKSRRDFEPWKTSSSESSSGSSPRTSIGSGVEAFGAAMRAGRRDQVAALDF